MSAPPEKGRANTAVERVLAEALGLPAKSVSIVAGGSSSRKTVEIVGMAAGEVHSALNKA